MNSTHLVVENFFDGAAQMRAAFEAHFREPHRHTDQHQVWNYWYVPELYTYLRANPHRIMPEELANRFVQWINVWAMANLGLSYRQNPWLSVYINGCGQGLHNDSLNGQMGFVYSITKWDERNFLGGETILFRGENYWGTDRIKTSGAGATFYEKVPSRFNQLLVFDDRVIHGVSPVQGTMDPVQGRVVVHGHLKAESAILTGSLPPDPAYQAVSPVMPKVLALTREMEPFFHGFATLRLHIAPDGKVTRMQTLCDRILPLTPDTSRLEPFKADVKKLLTGIEFPASNGPSEFTLPVLIGT